MKTTWAQVSAGDTVEMAGRSLTVVTAKVTRSGKKVDVTVRDAKGVFSSRVVAADKVKIPKLHEVDKASNVDRQQRWATKPEAEETERREGLPAGDPSVTKRPARAAGNPWDKPQGKAEKMVADILGATLVGEATDENVGYYVPPVDLSTVAAHLMLFHGVLGSEYETPMDALAIHDQHHRDAKTGAAMKVNHWHTKERP